jgi:hypothetical protein
MKRQAVFPGRLTDPLTPDASLEEAQERVADLKLVQTELRYLRTHLDASDGSYFWRTYGDVFFAVENVIGRELLEAGRTASRARRQVESRKSNLRSPNGLPS